LHIWQDYGRSDRSSEYDTRAEVLLVIQLGLGRGSYGCGQQRKRRRHFGGKGVQHNTEEDSKHDREWAQQCGRGQ
jgi:uncharacterized protein HemX